jgi:quinol monooxygenase YgiN
MMPINQRQLGYIVTVLLQAKPGQHDHVADILSAVAAPTREEPGVQLFLPYRSKDDPSQFMIFERYVDEAAWHAHQATEHCKTAIADLTPLLARRERVVYEALA